MELNIQQQAGSLTPPAGKTATEWLWFNFAPPVALHDYRYLGNNFRERERIKRKKQRWTARLERMPLLERQALLCAIDESRDTPDSRRAGGVTDAGSVTGRLRPVGAESRFR